MNLIRTCLVFASLSLISVGPVAAQQPQQRPEEHERAKKPDPVTGELLGLNTATKTLTVKTTPDSEMKFSYSEDTEIVGADQGAAGLATSGGAIVTVTYDVHGTANIALKIEVRPKQ
jgi:hypothetical protein